MCSSLETHYIFNLFGWELMISNKGQLAMILSQVFRTVLVGVLAFVPTMIFICTDHDLPMYILIVFWTNLSENKTQNLYKDIALTTSVVPLHDCNPFILNLQQLSKQTKLHWVKTDWTLKLPMKRKKMQINSLYS